MQWCTFVSIAHRSPARPSITQSSHSGRSRSRRRAMTSATSRYSASSSPGWGSATRRTCRAMSKSGSSTHCGAPRSNGYRRSRWANRGQARIRSENTDTRSCCSGAGPSMTARPPIARLTRGSTSSALRNPLSSVVRWFMSALPNLPRFICNPQYHYSGAATARSRAKGPSLPVASSSATIRGRTSILDV